MKYKIRLLAGIAAVVLTGISYAVGASEVRQTRYVHESPSVVWKDGATHLICDNCPPFEKRSWSAADFAERIVKIKVPSSVETEVSGKEKMPSELAGKPLFLHFDFNSSVIRKPDMKELRDYASKIKEQGNTAFIEIEGYTDGVGTKEYNDSLASRRAESVYKALESMGVDGSNMRISGAGKCCYVDSDMRSGKNRRVKVIHSKEGSEGPSQNQSPSSKEVK